MAFIFPEDKATFTAPNGITYAWKEDHWVVQKFKGDHEVYVSPTPPDNPAEGKLWYDSTGDVIELFIYVNDAWVSATPNSEYALESRIAQNEQGIRDLWSDQTRQDFEISSLDTRVDALEGVVGQYAYDIQTANATPRNGQIAFLKGDMSTTTRWGDATNIAVNPNSKNGEIWPTDEIVTGDVLRFHLKGDIAMEVSAFEAKVVQNNNNLFSIDLVVKEVGTIMDGAEYEVFHLSSFDPSGLATMDYVDAQDVSLKNYTDGQIADLQSQIDDTDGAYLSKQGLQDLASDTWRIRQPNAEGNNRSFITIHNGAMNLYHVADPTDADDNWAANKGYVDKHLKLTGGALTGPVDIAGAARLKTKDDDGNVTSTLYPSGFFDTKNEIRIDRSGTEQCFAVKQDGTPKFTIQATGKAVTQYAIAADDDGKVLTTKEYVDQAAGVLNPPPARFTWKYIGSSDDHSPVNLQPGEFCGPSLASWNSSTLKWYFHKQPLNATKPIYQDYQYERQMTWQTPGPLLTMWEDLDDKYLPKIFAKMKKWEIRHGPAATNNGGPYISCDCYTGDDHSHTMSGVSLSRDRIYYINFGGIL